MHALLGLDEPSYLFKSRPSVPLLVFVGKVLSTRWSSAVSRSISGQEQVDIPGALILRMSGLSVILNKIATFSSLRGIITKYLTYLGAPF